MEDEWYTLTVGHVLDELNAMLEAGKVTRDTVFSSRGPTVGHENNLEGPLVISRRGEVQVTRD